jgi:hypothetical protein
VSERVELASPAALEAEDRIGHGRAGWREALRASGADALIARSRSPLAQLVPTEPGWRLAKSDGTASLYVRDGATPRSDRGDATSPRVPRGGAK